MRQLVVELVRELVPQVFVNIHYEDFVPHEEQVAIYSLVEVESKAGLDQWFVTWKSVFVAALATLGDFVDQWFDVTWNSKPIQHHPHLVSGCMPKSFMHTLKKLELLLFCFGAPKLGREIFDVEVWLDDVCWSFVFYDFSDLIAGVWLSFDNGGSLLCGTATNFPSISCTCAHRPDRRC